MRKMTKALTRGGLLLLGLLVFFAGLGWAGLLILQSGQADNVIAVGDFFRRFWVVFFLARLALYAAVWIWWDPLTRRAGRKRGWDRNMTEHVIAERHRILPWLAFLEALILFSMLSGGIW